MPSSDSPHQTNAQNVRQGKQPDAQTGHEDDNDPDQTAMSEIKITTTPQIGQSSSPRQPNDRDESPDSQASGGARADMQQAAADLASGQVDTDRYQQPAKNPLNRAPATNSPRSSQKLPDGSRK